MTYSPERRTEELGLDLAGHPMAPGPIVAVVIDGDRAWVSGQPPSTDGKIQFTGPVGPGGLTTADGYQAARLCTLNALAALRAALGSLDRVHRIIKVVGLVQAPSGWAEQSKVVNGASELLVEVFGPEGGKHARTAMGVASLPGNMSVEIEMVVAINGDGTGPR